MFIRKAALGALALTLVTAPVQAPAKAARRNQRRFAGQ